MITAVEVLGYRCFQYVRVRLRPFVVLVGPNASGKTSFLDLLAFLRDLLKDGPAVAARARADEFEDLTWMREGQSFEVALDVALPEHLVSDGRDSCRYGIRVGRGEDGEVGIEEERLWLRPRPDEGPTQRVLFPAEPQPPGKLLKDAPRKAKWRVVLRKVPESGNDYFRSEKGEWNTQFRVGPKRAALASLPEDETRFPAATWLRRFLEQGVQSLQLNSLAMRRPVSPREPTTFQPDGSNLPLVVDELKTKRPERFREWVKHLQVILPDLDDVEVHVREADRFRYLVLRYSSGLQAPSWLVSDGTLRMLALTLPAYIEARDRLFLIEEPENGLHPKALEPVFQSLSSVYEGQVLVATHSIVLVGMASPGDILCFAKTASGATDVVPGDEHPALQEWRAEVNLGTLLAAGVLG